jgi:pimeloyl-ACP methyl ester carboxylesterase
MFEEGFFKSNDLRLHFIDWGGEGEALVMQAGLGSTAHIYRSLAPRFAQSYRVAALTRRGHGRAEHPGESYDMKSLVGDIIDFLDELAIESAIFIGHSFAGVEIPYLTASNPERVKAVVYLDAVFPRSVPVPDQTDDPIWTEIPTDVTPTDLTSLEAYLNYYRRYRPDLARIWNEAIQADVAEFLSIGPNSNVIDDRDNELLNGMYGVVWSRLPDYDLGEVPALAVVPDGDYHPGRPLEASNELRRAADQYWLDRVRPWIRQRTEAFRAEAPAAQIVELDSPNHHIFIDKEDETVKAIDIFLDEIA